MAIQISPGVSVTEYDGTTTVPTVSTTAGAIAGVFRWGPIGSLVSVDTETTLWKRFGKPTNFNAETFFTAANFLAYGNQLYVSRAANTTDTTTDGFGTFSAIADTSGVIAANVAGNTYWGSNVNATFNITNRTAYNTAANNGSFSSNPTYLYTAKYPGAIGSSLTISTVDTANAYSSNLVNIANTTFAFNSNAAVISFNDTSATINAATAAANLASYVAYQALTVGDWITVGNSTVGTQTLQVASKGTAPSLIINSSATFTASSNTVTGLTGMSNAYIGYSVSSSVAGLANNTTIVSVPNATSVILSNQFTGTTGSGTFKAAQEFLNLSFYTPYTLSVPYVASGNIGRLWQYYNAVTAAPGVSYYGSNFGNNVAVDSMHVVVADTLGKFTGVPGQILEVFQGVSRATDAKTVDGATNYYVNVLNQNSNYVWVTNLPNAAYVNTSVNMTSLSTAAPTSIAFAGGQDGFSESNVGTNIGAITAAYDMFKSTERVSISLLMTGKSDETNKTLLGNYLIQNIAQPRMDCVVFISPNAGSVVNNVGNELASVQAFRAGLTASSYGVMDSGYKYMYDRYNDVYRYVPLNGDIAGLCVFTDTTKDPWWSPAGFNRGQIKNLVRLAYNPTKSDRDILYPLSVNPVVTFPGQGTILYGDKTLANPSAFDRINVRRLFIILEKTIAQAAQNLLFEFNNAFTQAQFVSLVTPFLQQVQGRQGITDFKVVCDSTNNTPAVVDGNQFVGDIYVKPARSINYIQLNFVAVRTGVDFSEIIGQF